MKTTTLTPVKTLSNSQFWLVGIGAGLIAIILTLTQRTGDFSHLGMSVLFYFAVASLLGEKRHNLNLESGLFSSLLGILLIAGVLWQSASLTSSSKLLPIFTHIAPFVSAIGLALLASGLKGLKQYWQEITILFFLGVPKIVLTSLTDISPITAKFSAFLLWYSGFEVSLQQEIFIRVPPGSIKVYSGCSGVELMSHLLGLAVIALLMFPLERKKKILVPIVAITIAFVVNGIRVALLAVVVTQQQAFDYWHEGDGSRLFGMIAVLILGLFYYLLLRQGEGKNQGNLES
ncbi:cyanoexosortase A [Komarekiella sp. 'clone 1']|uniref:Cyanoexosortase A n=1 Tax=Komarekiella delphini-convector SJRDD-AB1 TaxID=2593771 RepID=A0AA40SSB8_9NOST|nr:cyanoexosortase A [Komarekiella delphini-convector]MBD6614330.1 cyanoexosortase A [Komarekiella delphini-convector SJRDD-AB1]